jgi:hypothetical protein
VGAGKVGRGKWINISEHAWFLLKTAKVKMGARTYSDVIVRLVQTCGLEPPRRLTDFEREVLARAAAAPGGYMPKDKREEAVLREWGNPAGGGLYTVRPGDVVSRLFDRALCSLTKEEVIALLNLPRAWEQAVAKRMSEACSEPAP